jgi:hypothetical protein
VLTRAGVAHRPASAASQRHVPTPRLQHPTWRGAHNEASTRIHAIHPSGLPLTCRHPGWNEQPLGLSPELRTPPGQEPSNARRGGDRPSSTSLELHAQLTSVDPPSGSSLNACDLASHATLRSSRSGRARATARYRIRPFPIAGLRRDLANFRTETGSAGSTALLAMDVRARLGGSRQNRRLSRHRDASGASRIILAA